MKTAQERLKLILSYTNLTPKSLTQILNLKNSIILNINKGVQKSFSYSVAKAINKAFAISIDWIMDGEGEIFIKPDNTLERRAINLDELMGHTQDIGKRFDALRTLNNISIEEFIKILEISKERYLEICLENKLLTMREAILLKANFNVKIDDFIFDETGEINKTIGDKSELNSMLNKLSPIEKVSLKKNLKK